jgi:hypothetical protein
MATSRTYLLLSLVARSARSLRVSGWSGRRSTVKPSRYQEVYHSGSGAQLRLITCGGTFNHETGHYVDNIVVFAHLA